MKKQKQPVMSSRLWRALLTMLLLVAAITLVYGHRAIFLSSLQAASHAHVAWLAAAFLLTAGTFLAAAATYVVLALHRLRYGQTVLVELATAFVNRLLPAGLGGLSLLGRYLYKRKHTSSEAIVVVSANNVLGMVGHVALLVAAAATYPHAFLQFKTGHIHAVSWQIAVCLMAIACGLVSIKPLRLRIVRFSLNIYRSLRELQVRKVVSALLLSMSLTMLYTSILLCSARAVGVQLGFVQIFIAFSTSVLAGTVAPTPGGLVGAEAGLLGGLLAFGVSSMDAGAVVVIYRTMTYWLPLLPGYAALLLARQRKLV